MNRQELASVVKDAMAQTKIIDIHTHIYPASFQEFFLWGIDELLTYHYLVAETMRWVNMPYEEFWAMDKRAQADLVWKTLFVENTPYSEACRGVLTVLKALGLDTGARDLEGYREYFRSLDPAEYVDRVFALSGVESVVMTNDPFKEKKYWDRGEVDPRFKGALRIDNLLVNWPQAVTELSSLGYSVSNTLDVTTYAEVRRFLEDWIERMSALYVAASLSYDFVLPSESPGAKILDQCILPVCRDRNLPFAPMIGVVRRINPALGDAGDAVRKADIGTVGYLCSRYPENKFLVTLLSRENQHELAVLARKFRNLMVFGCWWFLNNPSLVEEITRMRMELLGTSFIPQHSDARVLDQLIYKWNHSKEIIAKVLVDKYSDLLETGWVVTKEEIQRDVQKLFAGNFQEFLS